MFVTKTKVLNENTNHHPLLQLPTTCECTQSIRVSHLQQKWHPKVSSHSGPNVFQTDPPPPFKYLLCLFQLGLDITPETMEYLCFAVLPHPWGVGLMK